MLLFSYQIIYIFINKKKKNQKKQLFKYLEKNRNLIMIKDIQNEI